MMTFKNILAASAATAAFAVSAAAFAAAPPAPPEYNGSLSSSEPSTSVVLGTQTSSTSGDLATCGSASSTCTNTNTTTTIQNQVKTTSSGSLTSAVSTTVNGVEYSGTKTLSGTGSQNQTVTGTLVEVYTPGNPPVIATSTPTTGTPVNVGASSVTAVSATGSVGNTQFYSSTLSTSGTPNSSGAVVATENGSTLNSAGLTLDQRVGTATYNAGTATVTVALPAAPTSSTNLSAAGLTTTGSVSAASGSFTSLSAGSLNMNGGKITNLAAGTAATDAVNFGQFSTFQTSVNSQITTLTNNLTGLVNKFNKRLEGGIAVATALSGGAFLPDKKINITGNIGAYRGEVAGSLQIGALISENIALNAGVATGFSSGAGTAVRGGFTFGF